MMRACRRPSPRSGRSTRRSPSSTTARSARARGRSWRPSASGATGSRPSPSSSSRATCPASSPRRARVLGAFLGADPDDLAFVANATGAANAVLRSLRLEPGRRDPDRRPRVQRGPQRRPARRRTRRAPASSSPGSRSRSADEDQVVDAMLGAVTDRTRIAILSHVTSPTALVLPIERIVAALAERGIETFVDGAHAPGMLPLDLDRDRGRVVRGQPPQVGLRAEGRGVPPRPAATARTGVRPPTISHGANAPVGAGGHLSRYRAEFDWQGTLDPTPWLSVPAALAYVGGLLDGGWPAVMARNHELTLRGPGRGRRRAGSRGGPAGAGVDARLDGRAAAARRPARSRVAASRLLAARHGPAPAPPPRRLPDRGPDHVRGRSPPPSRPTGRGG